MEKVNVKPAEQRVMILPDPAQERTTKSGIIIPKSAEDKKPETGVVVRVGRGSKDDPMDYSVGQRVMYSQYSGLEIEVNLLDHGEHVYKVMNQMDIMAVIESAES